MDADRGQEGIWVLLEQVRRELVRMLRPDAVGSQRGFREVGEIEGHDQRHPRGNRRRQNVPVVGVRQRERGDQSGVLGDVPVPSPAVHQFPSALQARPLNVGPVLQHLLDLFLMDLVSPLRLEEEADRQVHEEVSKRRRVQDAGVQQRGRHSYSPARCASALISPRAAEASC